MNKYTRIQRIMPQRMSNKNLVVNFSTRRVSGIKRFEETKLIIRIRKSKKDKQRNGQKEKDKQWSKSHYRILKIEQHEPF